MSKAWLQTYTGGRVDLPDLAAGEGVDPAQISIVDIAYHLAGITRFNGALQVRYSVAQHSIWVAKQVYYENRLGLSRNELGTLSLLALLHDAHEAYMGDLIRPMKGAMPLDAKLWWDDLSRAFDEAIREQAELLLDLPDAWVAVIKTADMCANDAEAAKGMLGGPQFLPLAAAHASRQADLVLCEAPVDDTAKTFIAEYRRFQSMRYAS